MAELTFNLNNGYLEGLVRGFKGGILKQTDYLNLVQCETLEGIFSLRIFGLLFSYRRGYLGSTYLRVEPWHDPT